MKRKLLLITVMTLIACTLMAGCSKYGVDTDSDDRSIPPINSGITSVPSSSVTESESSVPEEPKHKSAPPEFDVNNIQINKMLDTVKPFNVFPEEFEDASTLSDYCIFFTVAEACNMKFGTDEVTGVDILTFDDFYKEVDSYFGGKAKLSDKWAENDYTPYVLDTANKVITRNSAGSVGSYYFTYKVLDNKDGTYDLWLIDLMDPLFYGDVENRVKLDAGEEIEWADIEEIADQMTTNIYELTIGEEGYYISGFKYLNYKEIDHLGF